MRLSELTGRLLSFHDSLVGERRDGLSPAWVTSSLAVRTGTKCWNLSTSCFRERIARGIPLSSHSANAFDWYGKLFKERKGWNALKTPR
jgi:hypothetical protein